MIESIIVDFLNSISVRESEQDHFVNYFKGKYNDPEMQLIPDTAQALNYYTDTVNVHKKAVYEAGEKLIDLGIAPAIFRYQLVVHDFSKYSFEELAYITHNFKDKSKNSIAQKEMFEMAWNHHKQRNEHHPEHWLSVDKSGKVSALMMPKKYIWEMVADWIGAGETYGNSLEDWLPENLPKFLFHHRTRLILTDVLEVLGIDTLEIDGFLHVK